MSRPWWQTFTWYLGFLLAANLYVVPQFAQSPRATDLMGLVLAAWLLWRLGSRGMTSAPLVALALVNVLPLAWFLMGLPGRQMPTLTMSLRWLLALPWGLALLYLTRTVRQRDAFLWGLVWGVVVNLVVLTLQATGLESIPRAIGLSTTDSAFHHTVYHSIRLPGLHGHHAATAAVTSLIVPVGLYLYFRGKAGIWLPALGICGLFATANFTSTRSPLLVAVATLLVFVLLAPRPARAAALFGLAGAVLLPLFLIFGPPGGKLRWQDMVSAEANLAERVTSTSSALELSLENPLGLGVKQGQIKLIEHGGIDATHNAFMQASLFFGLPLAAAMFLALAHLMWQVALRRGGAGFLEGILAWHLFGLFMFEEHMNNPTFVILASWLIATSALRLAGKLEPDPAPPVVHESRS